MPLKDVNTNLLKHHNSSTPFFLNVISTVNLQQDVTYSTKYDTNNATLIDLTYFNKFFEVNERKNIELLDVTDHMYFCV